MRLMSRFILRKKFMYYKFMTYTGTEPVTYVLLVRCSTDCTNWQRLDWCMLISLLVSTSCHLSD